MQSIKGNIVSPQHCGYGTLTWDDGVLHSVEIQGEMRQGEAWVLPGFIDPHLHGLGKGESSAEHVALMGEYAPRVGVTTLCPALASDTTEKLLKFIETVRDLAKNRPANSAFFAGSHLEGPYLDLVYGGGMDKTKLRLPDLEEVEKFLKAADGTLRIMTLAPELPGCEAVIHRLVQAGVQVSAGHSALQAQNVQAAVQAGVRQVCHLYDAYAGRDTYYGVPIPCLADVVTITDELMLEIIMDGKHVPQELVRLAIRAAGVSRIICITDAMRGTGLPDTEYSMTDGRIFTLTNGDVCRLKDDPDTIVGSCLTMNRAFKNLLEKFQVTPVDAARITSGNAAKILKIEHLTGALKVGLRADITCLAPESCQVLRTFVAGQCLYEA